jgi:hypothetical protein
MFVYYAPGRRGIKEFPRYYLELCGLYYYYWDDILQMRGSYSAIYNSITLVSFNRKQASPLDVILP